MSNIILVVAAHPDDEILGCGGTVARLANEGAKVYTLLLGQGIASRHDNLDKTEYQGQVAKLKKCMDDANRSIGVQEVFSFDFPDNKFDTVGLLDIVKTVEKIKNKIKANVIFTHYEKDLNIDHRITYEAVITATRPLATETVKTIYSFEVLSSTEWHYPVVFSPDTFFDISNTMKQKQKALACYETELRPFPHTRSLEGSELNAKVWGMKIGVDCAEAFKTVRNLI
ncbi:MAG: PIG-L family deacetylase [Desulfobacteraceae bacterium]|nr:PIG-L family deacetylase [Desulfobacteraceae bacterium]